MSSFWNQKVLERIAQSKLKQDMLAGVDPEMSLEVKLNHPEKGRLQIVLKGDRKKVDGLFYYAPK